jgi:hypothetical protein
MLEGRETRRKGKAAVHRGDQILRRCTAGMRSQEAEGGSENLARKPAGLGATERARSPRHTGLEMAQGRVLWRTLVPAILCS